MLPLIISYNYEIVYHRQKERESLKSPFPCCFGRFFSFLHFLMAYFSTKFELCKWKKILRHRSGDLFCLNKTSRRRNLQHFRHFHLLHKQRSFQIQAIQYQEPLKGPSYCLQPQRNSLHQGIWFELCWTEQTAS